MKGRFTIMMQITDVILIALFIEAVVNALKPIWSKDGDKLSVSEYVSMGMGVLLAVACRINMLAYVVEIAYPAWVEYVFFVLTGIAIGRGTNFIYDLWGKLKEFGSAQEHGPMAVKMDMDVVDADGVSFKNWTLAQLKACCEKYGIDTTGCVNKSDYMSAIQFFCLTADGETVDGEKKVGTTATDAHADPDAYLMREAGNPPIRGAE